ncbi:MAG: methyltransferase [Clostridia bacterium]|nr:methyltransferase [Clostridia bacterium]
MNTPYRHDIVNEDLTLIQNTKGLTYGTDAYLLAAYMCELHVKTAVEFGGGTGIISLLTATKRRADKIVCCEIQPEFCRLIGENAAANGLSDRIEPLSCDVRELRAATLGYEADAVFTNPPYMKAESGKRNEADEKYLARHEVCGTIYDFCAAADRVLKFGGKFFVVWRPDRLADLMDAMRRSHLEPKRMTFVHADTATPPSMVLVEAKKGAAPSLILTKPLILYTAPASGNAPRVYTEDARRIYEDCSFTQFFKS